MLEHYGLPVLKVDKRGNNTSLVMAMKRLGCRNKKAREKGHDPSIREHFCGAGVARSKSVCALFSSSTVAWGMDAMAHQKAGAARHNKRRLWMETRDFGTGEKYQPTIFLPDHSAGKDTTSLIPFTVCSRVVTDVTIALELKKNDPTIAIPEYSQSRFTAHRPGIAAILTYPHDYEPLTKAGEVNAFLEVITGVAVGYAKGAKFHHIHVDHGIQLFSIKTRFAFGLLFLSQDFEGMAILGPAPGLSLRNFPEQTNGCAGIQLSKGEAISAPVQGLTGSERKKVVEKAAVDLARKVNGAVDKACGGYIIGRRGKGDYEERNFHFDIDRSAEHAAFLALSDCEKAVFVPAPMYDGEELMLTSGEVLEYYLSAIKLIMQDELSSDACFRGGKLGLQFSKRGDCPFVLPREERFSEEWKMLDDKWDGWPLPNTVPSELDIHAPGTAAGGLSGKYMSLNESWTAAGSLSLKKSQLFDQWHPSDLIDEIWESLKSFGSIVDNWPKDVLDLVIGLTRSESKVIQFHVSSRIQIETSLATRRDLLVDLERRGIKRQVIAFVVKNRPGGKGSDTGRKQVVTNAQMGEILKQNGLKKGAIEVHTANLIKQVWDVVLLRAGATEVPTVIATSGARGRTSKNLVKGTATCTPAAKKQKSVVQPSAISSFAFLPGVKKTDFSKWESSWGATRNPMRWLHFPGLSSQVFLVDWGDEFRSIMCTIHADSTGVPTATELIPGTLDTPSYALEETTLVRPISSATVDFHDDAGPCKAALSVLDCKLLAKSLEWEDGEFREGGCFIEELREIEDDDEEESGGWTVYDFK